MRHDTEETPEHRARTAERSAPLTFAGLADLTFDDISGLELEDLGPRPVTTPDGEESAA